MFWTTVVVVAPALLAMLWAYPWRRGRYWRRRRVPHETAWPLLGSRARFYLLQESLVQYTRRVYRKHRGASVVGLDTGARRELLICDVSLARRVLITDFANFMDRGYNSQPVEETEPLRRNLLAVDGNEWRWLRQVLSPAFSPARIRAMFPLITEKAQKLRMRVASLPAATTDARALMARYTVDFIGACGFGLDGDSLNTENNILYRMASKIFRYHIVETIAMFLKELFPRATKNLKYLSRVENDIFNIVNTVQKQRDFKPSDRNDFMDVLLEIRQRQKSEKMKDVLLMDDKLMAAQVFIFFAAGFETSATSTSYALHLLAHHPEIQERARAEVDAVLARHDGVLSYEAVREMTYLMWTLKESMRLFPPVGNLVRQVARACQLPGAGDLERGLRVLVPVAAFHLDPQYFPAPDEFLPERFHPDNFSPKAKLAYMPFGAGPRCCIGEQLGLLVSAAGVAAALAAARAAPAPRAPPPRPDPRAYIVQSVRGGIPLVFHTRHAEERYHCSSREEVAPALSATRPGNPRGSRRPSETSGLLVGLEL